MPKLKAKPDLEIKKFDITFLQLSDDPFTSYQVQKNVDCIVSKGLTYEISFKPADIPRGKFVSVFEPCIFHHYYRTYANWQTLLKNLDTYDVIAVGELLCYSPLTKDFCEFHYSQKPPRLFYKTGRAGSDKLLIDDENELIIKMIDILPSKELITDVKDPFDEEDLYQIVIRLKFSDNFFLSINN